MGKWWKQLNWERRLSILLPILHLLVTIGGGIVLVYRGQQLELELAHRDEQMEKELVQLAAEVERRTSVAHLTASSICLDRYPICDDAVEIRNLGPAGARNLRTVITIARIAEPWNLVIDDIDMFTAKTFPAALEVTAATLSVDVLHPEQEVAGDNAIEITADILPPNAALETLLMLSPSVEVERFRVARRVRIYGGTPELPLFPHYYEVLAKYLKERFSVATFRTGATCDNCEGIEDAGFSVSTLGAWYYLTMDYLEGPEGPEWVLEVTADYWMPSSSGHEPDTSVLYLQAGRNESGEAYLKTLPAPR